MLQKLQEETIQISRIAGVLILLMQFSPTIIVGESRHDIDFEYLGSTHGDSNFKVSYKVINPSQERIAIYLDLFAVRIIDDVADIINERRHNVVNTVAVISRENLYRTINNQSNVDLGDNILYAKIFPKIKILSPGKGFILEIIIPNQFVKSIEKPIIILKLKYGCDTQIEEIKKRYGAIDSLKEDFYSVEVGKSLSELEQEYSTTISLLKKAN